jgi:hypothetical protein
MEAHCARPSIAVSSGGGRSLVMMQTGGHRRRLGVRRVPVDQSGPCEVGRGAGGGQRWVLNIGTSGRRDGSWEHVGRQLDLGMAA